MIWLISDTHFGHDKKFIYGPRGFQSVQEADSTIIRNWNDAIGKGDEVRLYFRDGRAGAVITETEKNTPADPAPY